MKPIHSTILATFGGVLASIGLASPTFGLFLPVGGLLVLFGLADGIGGLAFSKESRSIRVAFGALGAAALFAAAGAATYYAYRLDAMAISALCILLPWLVFALSPFRPDDVPARADAGMIAVEKTAPADSASALLLVLTVGADLAALRWLAGAATEEAIRSPWEVVHPIFFLWICLATFCLTALAYRKRYPHLCLAAAALHLFTLLSPALLVYRIGYGFDPFIHIATEKLAAATGAVTPKTPYYLGQYALVIILSKLARAPVELTDRLLLPGLTSVFLPLAAAWLLRRGFGVSRQLTVISSFGVFLLPLASFASTTPQGLANLFFLLTVMFGTAWLHAHRPPLAFVLLLAAASLAAHPLSGIPAFLFAGFLMALKLKEHPSLAAKAAKAALFILLFAAAAAAIPGVFSLRGAASAPANATVRKPWPELLTLIPYETPGVETRYKPALDFAEFVARNHETLLLLLAVGGAWLLGRKRGYRRTALAAAGLSAALLVSVIVLKNGFVFQGVIGYEQANYGNRLYETALLAAFPLVLAAFAWWWRALGRSDAGVRIFQTLAFAAAVTALAYAAFPRVDDFRYARGYSTSSHDVKAVRFIAESGVPPYVVLANQSTSAAALREYGFSKYYGDQFYYSIPTGAPLYQYYLEMVYRGPSRETAEAAMRSMGVPTLYFVIDRYWTNSGRVVEDAKKTADAWTAIDNGEVYVFRYELK